MQANSEPQHDNRHFAFELAGLVVRIVATAIAINIVLGALVLALAGQAHAAATPAAPLDAIMTSPEQRLARAAPSTPIEPLFIVLHRHMA